MGSYCVPGAVKQLLSWTGICNSLLELFWWWQQLHRAGYRLLLTSVPGGEVAWGNLCAAPRPWHPLPGLAGDGGRMCWGHRGVAHRAVAFADLLLLCIRCCGFALRC